MIHRMRRLESFSETASDGSNGGRAGSERMPGYRKKSLRPSTAAKACGIGADITRADRRRIRLRQEHAAARAADHRIAGRGGLVARRVARRVVASLRLARVVKAQCEQ